MADGYFDIQKRAQLKKASVVALCALVISLSLAGCNIPIGIHPPDGETNPQDSDSSLTSGDELSASDSGQDVSQPSVASGSGSQSSGVRQEDIERLYEEFQSQLQAQMQEIKRLLQTQTQEIKRLSLVATLLLALLTLLTLFALVRRKALERTESWKIEKENQSLLAQLTELQRERSGRTQSQPGRTDKKSPSASQNPGDESRNPASDSGGAVRRGSDNGGVADAVWTSDSGGAVRLTARVKRQHDRYTSATYQDLELIPSPDGEIVIQEKLSADEFSAEPWMSSSTLREKALKESAIADCFRINDGARLPEGNVWTVKVYERAILRRTSSDSYYIQKLGSLKVF